MKRGGVGGTNTKTGIAFEGRVDIKTALSRIPGYKVDGHIILYNDEEIARSYVKNSLYIFLKEQGIDYTNFISKKLLPDDAIYVIKDNTINIIEIKFQSGEGSVDEKLQTCDFKKKQYQKLLSSLNYEVQYIYILNDWFRKEAYKDVRDYILSVGCRFYFEYLPLKEIGRPV